MGWQPVGLAIDAKSLVPRQPAKVAPFAGVTKLVSEKAPQATFSNG